MKTVDTNTSVSWYQATVIRNTSVHAEKSKKITRESSMSFIGKIKYFFDGAEEAEESGLILSRRKFFIASAALMIVPSLLDGHVTAPTYSIGEGTDFFAPGALELTRYQDEILRTLKDKGPRITFKPMEATIHLSEEDVKKGFEFVNGRNVQEIPFYRYEIPDIKSPRNLILQHAAKRLGYRGKRM